MNEINQSTDDYEQWLKEQLIPTGGIDPKGLKLKHDKMSGGLFDFFRATFYRWAELWQTEGEDGARIAAVGDVHVENYGSWAAMAQAQGWGINDFDEAATLPWTSDLIRLGVSAAIGAEGFPGIKLTSAQAVAAILDGYSAGLGVGLAGGQAAPWDPVALPKVLEVLRKKDTAEEFWTKQDAKLVEVAGINDEAKTALGVILGDEAEGVKYRQRKEGAQKGTGSLGRWRYFALATVKGERVMAEAKAFAPSAQEWVSPGLVGPGLTASLEALAGWVEPEVRVVGAWVVRRLAPGMAKAELEDLEKAVTKGKLTPADVGALFTGMGAALAAIHAKGASAAMLAEELAQRMVAPGWFVGAVAKWQVRMAKDFAAYGATPPPPIT